MTFFGQIFLRMAFLGVFLGVGMAGVWPLHAQVGSGFGKVSTSPQIIMGDNFITPLPSNSSYGPRLRRMLPAQPTQGDGRIQIMPASIQYKSVLHGLSPLLDSNLKLGLKYTYQFTVYVRAMTDANASANVPDGWYSMDMAVVLPDIDMPDVRALAGSVPLTPYDRFVSYGSEIVNVVDGKIVQEVSLRFPNITTTTIGTTLYMQLTPLQTECQNRDGQPVSCIQLNPLGLADKNKSQTVPKDGYISPMLSVPFVAVKTTDGGDATYKGKLMSPNPTVDASLKKYIYKANRYQAERRRILDTGSPSAQEYAASRRLHAISIHDPFLSATDPRLLNKKSPQHILKDLMNLGGAGPASLSLEQADYLPYLCSLLVAKNPRAIMPSSSAGLFASQLTPEDLSFAVQLCQSQSEKFLRMTVTEHILSKDNRGLRLEDSVYNYNVSTTFNVSRTSANNYSKSLGFSPLEPIYKIADLMGVPLSAIGVSANFSRVKADSRATGEIAGIWIGSPMEFRVLKAEIPVLESQRCLEIQAVPSRHSPLFDPTPNAHNGLYVCDDVSKTPHYVTETYAHLYSRAEIDNPNRKQSFNAFVQGDRDLMTFFFLNREALTPNFDGQALPSDFLAGSRQYFATTPSSTPGMVTSPLSFPRELLPTWGNMITQKPR